MTHETDRQEALDALEKLANTPMNISLADWCSISSKIRRALQQPSDPAWQTIETAPKDRTEILASDKYDIKIVRFKKGDWYVFDCADDWYSETFNPTHWMPLPAAPEYRGG